MNKLFYIPFFLLSCLSHLIAQDRNALYEAKINLIWKDGDAIVEGYFVNNTKKNEQLTYQLKLQRKSKNGNNLSNQQSGSFNVAANSDKLLAVTTFDVTELDLYRIYLKVYKKEKLIAEDAIVNWSDAIVTMQKRDEVGNADTKNPDLNDGKIDPNRPKLNSAQRREIDPQTLSREATIKARIEEARRKSAEAMAAAHARRAALLNKNSTPSLPSPNLANPPKKSTPASSSKQKTFTPTPHTPSLTPRTPDLEIDGLIIDETRTKIGRDYYEVFYNQWEAPAGAKNYTIKIKELPSRGRGAQIQVFVNDEKLIHRSLQPRQEMIEDMANRSVSALANWLVQNAKQAKNIADEGIY